MSSKNPKISQGMKTAKRRGVRIGRPVDAITQQRIAGYMGRYPEAKAPHISRRLGLPQSTVYAILKRLSHKDHKP